MSGGDKRGERTALHAGIEAGLGTWAGAAFIISLESGPATAPATATTSSFIYG